MKSRFVTTLIFASSMVFALAVQAKKKTALFEGDSSAGLYDDSDEKLSAPAIVASFSWLNEKKTECKFALDGAAEGEGLKGKRNACTMIENAFKGRTRVSVAKEGDYVTKIEIAKPEKKKDDE